MVKKLFKGSLNLIADSTTQILAIVISVYVARVLTVKEFGAVSLIKSITMYISFYTLGVREAVFFKLPALLAQKNEKEIKFNQHFLFTTSFLSVFFLILFFIFSFFKLPLNTVKLDIEWMIIGVSVVLGALNVYSNIIYSSYQNFTGMAIRRFFPPIIRFLFIYFLLKEFRIVGFLLSGLFSSIFSFIYSLKFVRDKIGFTWNNNILGEYFKIGFPIKLSTIIGGLLVSIDLWIISGFIGSKSAGLYGFIQLSRTAFRFIPNLMRKFVKPRTIWFYGKVHGDKSKLVRPVKLLIYCYISASVASSIIVLVFFHFLIKLYLVKYNPVIPLIPLLICGRLVSMMSGPSLTILVLLKKQMQILTNMIITVVLVTILDLIAAILFKDLYLIALSTAFGLALLGILNLIVLIKNLKLPYLIRFLTNIILMTSASIAIMIGIYNLLNIIDTNYYDLKLLIIVIPFIVSILIALRFFFKFWKYTERHPMPEKA